MNHSEIIETHWGLGLHDIERSHISSAVGRKARLRNWPPEDLPDAEDMHADDPFLIWVPARIWKAMSLERRRQVLDWDAPQKVLILDRDQDPDTLEEAQDEGFLSILNAPMDLDKAKAVLRRAREVRAVYDDIIRMTREISLEREILARKTDYLIFLNQFMNRAVESLNPATILAHAREDLDLLLPMQSAQAVFWQNEGEGSLEAELFLTFQEDAAEQEEWIETLLHTAARTSKREVGGYRMTYLMSAATPESGSAPAADRLILLPLKAGGRPFGCLALQTEEPVRLAREQRQVLHSAVNHLGLALNNALLYREVKTRADYDGLTRIHNRQYFDGRLVEELKRQQRYGTDLALMIFDLDHFKTVNDTYGHQAGDAVLREMGQLLSDSLRETDFAARYGGEEFAVILPHTDMAHAVALADRLRQRVSRLKFTAPKGVFSVTTSVGVASLSPGARNRDGDLLRKADEALYRAKNSGRDKVCTDGEAPLKTGSAASS